MFNSLAHLVIAQHGSRHNVEAEYESNLSQRGPLDKIWITCPNKLCRHHLSFKRSSKCLLLKCPICMKVFNPYSPQIIQCKKCKTPNSTPLWNQIIQCANKDCMKIINCWPVFRIEKYKELEVRDEKDDTNKNVIDLDSDNDEDGDVQIIDRIDESEEENKNDAKPETFLMVRESEIGAYGKYKKKNKKLYDEQKVIRMENERNGLVVIVNNSNQFKAKQNVIRRPKVYKSPFDWYFMINIDLWSAKYPNDNKLALLIKMKRYWKDEETERQKKVYIKMSKDDQERYEKEMKIWKTVEWMNEVPYDQEFVENEQTSNNNNESSEVVATKA